MDKDLLSWADERSEEVHVRRVRILLPYVPCMLAKCAPYLCRSLPYLCSMFTEIHSAMITVKIAVETFVREMFGDVSANFCQSLLYVH